MNEQYIKNVLEAGLLAAGRSLGLEELAALFGESERPGTAAIRASLAALEADYAGRGLELKETASGVRIQVRREFATEVSRLWPERPQRYSRALLETLALIAYRQPITRAEIEAVRGVAVNSDIVRTLLERGWVRVVGHRELPGRPELLGTTREFLDYFINPQLTLQVDAEGEAEADPRPGPMRLADDGGDLDDEPTLAPPATATAPGLVASAASED